MSTSKSTQKALTSQFISVTALTESKATRFLKQANWKLDAALNTYYTSSPDGASAANIKDTIGKLFEKYRASTDDKDTVGVDGTMSYLNDLEVNLENAEILVVLEIIQAAALGEMAKQGFIDGWSAIGADTIAKQKAHVHGQIKNLKSDIALFKRVYKHTFICAKDKGQKALPLENALVYWELLFTPPGKPWVTLSTNWTDLWMEFLNAKWTKSVNKDMWNQTFVFFEKTMEDESLGFWSEDGAWPGVIDDFVVYAKQKRGDAPESMETD